MKELGAITSRFKLLAIDSHQNAQKLAENGGHRELPIASVTTPIGLCLYCCCACPKQKKKKEGAEADGWWRMTAR